MYSEICTVPRLHERGHRIRRDRDSTEPKGKPYLKGRPRLEFSVSHTRCAAAVALAGEPVGVDVERLRDIDLGVASRRIFGREQALLHASRGAHERFFDMWTKKKRGLKRLASGCRADLKTCDVTETIPARALHSARRRYIISVCSAVKIEDGDLNRLTGPALKDMWRRQAG
jgi:phosphopantetheinyl transferase